MKKLYIFIALVAFSGLAIWSFLQYDFISESNVQNVRTTEVESVSEINRYENDSIADKLMAYNLATDFVIESLQEPTTAEFPNTKEKLKHTKYLGENRYRINSWVDSQDTYGAMTRRSFSCIVKTDSSGVIKESFKIEKMGYIPNNKQ
ncbi:hypothetical protein ACFS7Z_18890 [Pontibacter toksunensis]|uniref:Uncharacterized protein n=1 Tax=Pontibacter toksunensis TaxID=1332631 RepID=A0ABW6BXY0_9BACT